MSSSDPSGGSPGGWDATDAALVEHHGQQIAPAVVDCPFVDNP